MFITNGLSLIDGPHRIFKFILLKIHNFNQRKSFYKKPFKDTWEFPLAYNISFVIVIFVNCLIFAPLVVTFPFFGCLYFYLKHKADKYNLIFTYYKKYESGGRIKDSVVKLLYTIMILYMATMVGWFGYNGSSWENFFFYFSIFISFFWIGSSLIVLKLWHTDCMQRFFKLLGLVHCTYVKKKKII